MDIIQFVLGAVTGIAAAGAAGQVAQRFFVKDHRPGWFAGRCRKLVLLHLTDDRSLEGVLELVTEDGVVLRAARYLDAQNTPLAGEIYVPRDRVSFVQVPPKAALDPA